MQLGAERLNVNSLKHMDKFYMISLQVLAKKKQNTRRVYYDSRPSIPPHPTHRTQKVTKNVNLPCKKI